jgi:uncharacterized protein with HEPN domain
LLDILEHIRVIGEHLQGVTHEAFMGDVLRQDAVLRRIEVIGEAATRLSPELRAAHPEVPWQQIRDMRNFLIHVYDQVNCDRVWDTVQQDLAPLRQAVEEMLATPHT